jgi:hypothetical protein
MNPLVIFDWTQMLAAAITSLNPLHQDIVLRAMNVRGKGRLRLHYTEAKRLWNLDRDEFDRELAGAFDDVRRYLIRHGIRGAEDLPL